MHHIVAVMPIKLINERCPGKNTRMLGGKPLFMHELQSLKDTGLCDEIYVYCSDNIMASMVPEGIKFLQRPDYLDLPTSNFTQIIKCFMESIDSEIYVYAHATAPFIKVETIIECIKAVETQKYDSAFCAIRIQDFLWCDGRPLNFDATDLPRTQDLKPIFQETSGVYVFSADVFKKYGRRIGDNPYIKEVTIKEAVDIDTPDDFFLAEKMLSFDL